MFKLLFRLIALVFLVLAAITGILDITRSIADSTMVLTPLGQDWAKYHLSSLNLLQAMVQRYLHPSIWDPGIINILLLPSWLVFGVLALLFGIIGRKRKRRWQDQYGA